MLGRALLVEDSLARELTGEFALDHRKVMVSHSLVVLLHISGGKWEAIMDYLWSHHRRDVVDLRGTVQWCAVFAAVEQAEVMGAQQLQWVSRSRWQRAHDWLANHLPRRLEHWLFDAPPLRSGQARVDATAEGFHHPFRQDCEHCRGGTHLHANVLEFNQREERES